MSGRDDHRGSPGDPSWPPQSDADWLAWLAAPDDEAPRSPALGTRAAADPPAHPPAHPPRTLHDQGHRRGRRAAPASDDEWIAWLAEPDDDAPRSPAVGTPTTRPSRPPDARTSHRLWGPMAFTWPDPAPPDAEQPRHPTGPRDQPQPDAWPDPAPAERGPQPNPTAPHDRLGPDAWPQPTSPQGSADLEAWPDQALAEPGPRADLGAPHDLERFDGWRDPAPPGSPGRHEEAVHPALADEAGLDAWFGPAPAGSGPGSDPTTPHARLHPDAWRDPAPPDGGDLGAAATSAGPLQDLGTGTADANWQAWWTEGPGDHVAPEVVELPPRRLTPADLRTDFGPVPAPLPEGYTQGAGADLTEVMHVAAEVPVEDDALPLRSGWQRAGWVVRDLALLVLLAAAVAGAWVVLVTLRGPEPSGATDRLAQDLDRALAASLRADRVASFGTWLVNVTTTLVVGGVMFRTFVSTAQARALGWSPVRILRGAALVGVVASLAVLPFRAAVIAGTGRVAVTDRATLEFVATSKVGTAALLRVAGLLLATFAVAGPATSPRRHRPADGSALDHVLGIAGAVLLLASYAWVGHPQAAGGQATLLIAGQLVHVLAVSTWFGGVALLYLQIRAGRRAGAVQTSAEVVERFSVLAGLSLMLTAATGLVLAARRSRRSTP